MLDKVNNKISYLFSNVQFVYIGLFISFLISIVLHWHVFSLDIVGVHAWRQTETQTVINNFYEEDFNILHPRFNARGNGDGITTKEFPIMQWLIAALYCVFGKKILVTRIFMLITSFLGVIGIYKLIEHLSNLKMLGFLGAWCFSFSPTFFYYSVCPLPDVFALSAGIWGLYFYSKFSDSNDLIKLFLASCFLSLATLAKLPFVIFYAIPFTHLVFFLQKIPVTKRIQSISILIILTIPFIIWYYIAIPTWKGNGIVQGMSNNDLSYKILLGYLITNLVSVLPEMLLNYGSVLFFLVGSYFFIHNKPKLKSLFYPVVFCLLLLCFYVLFELNMIAAVHDYYLFPFLPFLFLAVAYGAFKIFMLNNSWSKIFVVSILLILPLTTFLRLKSRWNTDSPGFNSDLFKYQTELRNATPKNDLVIVGNDISSFIFLYYIDKKGWFFDNDNLDSTLIKEMIGNGAKYLYTDSKKIQNDVSILTFIEAKKLQKGSISVFKLK